MLMESKIAKPIVREAGGVAATLPGRHNAENVALAATLCAQLGHAPEKIRAALATFQGVQRRLEKVGARDGVTIFDDYAHNPAKIAAACAAVQPVHGRLFAVWRPHGFGPLALMLDELTAALAAVLRPQDTALILPVFYAGGTTQAKVTSNDLVVALGRRGVRATSAADYLALEKQVRAEWRPGDVVLVMGARDPDLPLFARRLAGLSD
jgi:UDP-N-acetylmuramate--alanine ligase